MRKIFKVIFLVLLIIELFSCNSEKRSNKNGHESITIKLGNKEYNVFFRSSPYKQKLNKRIWKNVKTEKQFIIGGKRDSLLYVATMTKTDNKGNIYVLDPPAFSVKKFNKSGKFIKKYGRKGKGPGEFISPFRFDVKSDGKRLAILDPNLNKCDIFSNDKLFHINLKYQPLGLCFISKNSFAVLQLFSDIEHSPFMIYNSVNNNIKEYENILYVNNLENIPLGPLTFLQGYIIDYNSDKFVYVPKYLDLFYIFTKDGKFSCYNTMDNKGIRSINRKSFKFTSFRLPMEKLSVISASIVDDKLIIISYQAKLKYNVCVADYYSLKTGNYTFSLKLKKVHNFGQVHFSKDRIFFNHPNGSLEVISYRIIDE